MNHSPSEHELLQQLAALPREIAPANDAWPGISSRISGVSAGGAIPSKRFRFWPLATAAALLVMLSAGLLSERFGSVSEPGLASMADSGDPVGPKVGPGFSDSMAVGEREYQAAFKEFLALDTAMSLPDRLSPEPIGQGWETLHQAEIQLQAALQEQPDNRFLNSRMTSLRARQIELLQQIAALEMASRRNTI